MKWRLGLALTVLSVSALAGDIILDLDESALNRLKAMRRETVFQGFPGKDQKKQVNATMTVGQKSSRVRLRLKGDSGDHWGDPHRWSLRVKTADDARVNGMREFSLQNPATRDGLREWVACEICRAEGLLAVRYDFVNLQVNNRSWGTVALEESFGTELARYHGRPDGVVLKIDEQLWLTSRALVSHYGEKVRFFGLLFFGGKALVFDKSRLEEDAQWASAALLAAQRLKRFADQQIPASSVFDIERTARWVALSQVLGARHGLASNNARFFYDFTTDRMEPVCFDMMAGGSNGFLEMPVGVGALNELILLLSQDPAFKSAWQKAIAIFTDPDWMENTIVRMSPALAEKRKIFRNLAASQDVDWGRFYQFRKRLAASQGVETSFPPRVAVRFSGNTNTDRWVIEITNHADKSVTIGSLHSTYNSVALKSDQSGVVLGPGQTKKMAWTVQPGPVGLERQLPFKLIYKVDDTRWEAPVSLPGFDMEKWLVEIGNRVYENIGYIESDLDSPDPGLSRIAATALKRLARGYQSNKLKELLASGKPAKMDAALAALWCCRDNRLNFSDQLTGLLNTPSETRRYSVARVLGVMGPEVLPVLRHTLESGTLEQRLGCAETLRDFGWRWEKRKDDLKRALDLAASSPYAAVRSVARQGLSMLPLKK